MTTVQHTDAPARLVVAIDGPSGSGKSSTARGVAASLGLAYLDTGAMYRALTLAWQESGLSAAQGEETAALLESSGLAISTDPQDQWVRVNGRDVTQEIRSPELSAVVSTVATMLPVRHALAEAQRRIIAEATAGIVAEGRDITTVVAPDADLRVLLVADPEARMARRQAETAGGLTRDAAVDQIVRRDRDDSTVSQFLEAADGVVVIDSTHLTLDEVIDRICTLAREARRGD